MAKHLTPLGRNLIIGIVVLVETKRLGENVFKDEAKLFYKLSRLDIPYEEFENYVNRKSEGTKLVLSGFNKLDDNEKIKNIDDRRKLVKSYRYNDDYAGVSERDGIICFNNLVRLSELRAWEVSQVNYKDDISMINELHSKGYIVENQDKPMIDKANDFLIEFSKRTYDFRAAYKYLCESRLPQEILNLILKISGDRSISFIDFKGLALCFNKENLINYYLSDLPDLIHQLREEKDWLLSGKVLLTRRALSVMKFLGFFKETCCPDYDHLRTLYVLNQTNVFVRP